MFLSTEDLVFLTGRKQPAAQRRVLTTRGIPFTLTADMRPVVRTDYNATPEVLTGRSRPRFDLLNRVA